MADTASIEIKNAGSAVHNDAPASSSTSEPSTGSFVHTPLEDPRRSIRLITFDKPSQHGTLCFRLEHHALTPSLVYNALSYEWGTPENQKTVFIEGRPFLLYDNLHAFLFQLQSRGTRTTPLFADAICIDQSNLVERNMQVQMMGKIYEQAKTVLVWLGPAADNSDFVFDVCNSEGQFNFEDIAQSDEENRLYPADYYPSLNTVEAARSLDAVFLRTYWNRLWIIQEMYVAREVELLCGTRTTTWETFNRLWVAAGAILPENGIIAEPGEESDARKHLRSLFLAMNSRFEPSYRMSLKDHLLRFGEAKCSDVRDKVYGLLGIADYDHSCNRPGDTGIRVDYGIPTEVLFLRLIESMEKRVSPAIARQTWVF